MGTSVPLLTFSLFFLSFASKATASTSTGSAKLLFEILDATSDNGDPVEGWNASKLLDSIEPNWKPGPAAPKEKDFISSLPGQPKNSLPIKQYGGYVDIGDGDNLFYYFVEADTGALSRPIILWINGGRGCSSVGSGAFFQNGPFYVNDDGKTLQPNHGAWVKVANVIYLDTPVNVGFSYSSKNKEKILYNDEETALSCLKFITGWLEKFPEYRNSSFNLAGGGYAGMVIPRLADLILEHNRRANSRSSFIKLAKIILGNPTIDAESEIMGVVDFQWIHGLASSKLRKEVKRKCAASVRSEECRAELRKLPVSDLGSGPVYPYDYTALACNTDLKPGLKVENYYECNETYVAEYLSQKEVQLALHGKSPMVSNGWTHCNEEVESNYKFSKSSLPIIKRLASGGIMFLIYSGDADIVVPTSGTRTTLFALNLIDGSEFNPWFSDPATIGGVTETYNKTINFAVFRGGGHLTARQHPWRTLSLIQNFV